MGCHRWIEGTLLVTVQSYLRSLRYRHFSSFVFIHINKTGGTSVAHALRIPFEHRTALEKRAELGPKRWSRRFKFAFVRNPWDKVVSHYSYRTRTNQMQMGAQPVDFNDWVRLSYGEQRPTYYDKPRMFMPQLRWLCDAHGELLVDFVGRFEQIEHDFHAICQCLGRTASLPHLKPSPREDYRSYYAPDTLAIVAEWFADDIERFGYRF